MLFKNLDDEDESLEKDPCEDIQEHNDTREMGDESKTSKEESSPKSIDIKTVETANQFESGAVNPKDVGLPNLIGWQVGVNLR